MRRQVMQFGYEGRFRNLVHCHRNPTVIQGFMGVVHSSSPGPIYFWKLSLDLGNVQLGMEAY